MLTAFVMSFRENIEILLIVISMFAYLKTVNKGNLKSALIWGCFTGILASISCGALLFKQYAALSGVTKQVAEGSILVFAAALILCNILWISGAEEEIPGLNKRNIQLSSISLFLLAFLTSFREYFEIFMFVLPYLDNQFFSVLAGLIIGLIAAVLAVWIAYRTSLKLNLKYIFSLITVLLVLVGTELFGEGLVTFFPTGGKQLQFIGYAVYGIPLLLLTAKRMLKK